MLEVYAGHLLHQMQLFPSSLVLSHVSIPSRTAFLQKAFGESLVMVTGQNFHLLPELLTSSKLPCSSPSINVKMLFWSNCCQCSIRANLFSTALIAHNKQYNGFSEKSGAVADWLVNTVKVRTTKLLPIGWMSQISEFSAQWSESQTDKTTDCEARNLLVSSYCLNISSV